MSSKNSNLIQEICPNRFLELNYCETCTNHCTVVFRFEFIEKYFFSINFLFWIVSTKGDEENVRKKNILLIKRINQNDFGDFSYSLSNLKSSLSYN